LVDAHICRFIWACANVLCSVYLEGCERFLLKAIYYDDMFYISTYEKFDIIPDQPIENCVAHMT
jgi:hypothetical protein